MPGDFGKMPKYASSANKSYCSMVCQMHKLKVLKARNNFTIHYFTYSGYISEIAATEGSYVMEGAAIIKLAALNSLA
jgi:Cu(I)/Ag(I) efflux system membrane fusion protein